MSAKGFTCKCGEYHEYSGYVFAHWYEARTHTCPKCGAQHRILEGVATPIRKRKPKK